MKRALINFTTARSESIHQEKLNNFYTLNNFFSPYEIYILRLIYFLRRSFLFSLAKTFDKKVKEMRVKLKNILKSNIFGRRMHF